MKAEIKAIFDSKYQENGIVVYFDASIVQDPQKFSNPYNAEYNTIGLTGFRDNWNKNWSKGMTVEFKLITQEHKGKTYLNFRPPEQSSQDNSEIVKLLQEIKDIVQSTQKSIQQEEPPKAPQEEENLDDIPF